MSTLYILCRAENIHNNSILVTSVFFFAHFIHLSIIYSAEFKAHDASGLQRFFEIGQRW